MTAPSKASHGLDLEFRPRDYQLRKSQAERLPGRSGLPPCLPGEVEIARITVGVVDVDNYSVRARRAGGRFQYRIVDQYFTTWSVEPRSSERRLSLGELLRLIDGARPEGWESSPEPLADLWRDRVAVSGGIETAAASVGVTSELYAALERYHQWRAELWLAARRAPGTSQCAA
ncbi:MAG: hypothetical protein ACHQ2E_08990 [Gemmatimonadales bacterium]